MYTLTFSLPGFRTFKRDGVRVSASSAAIINAEMSPVPQQQPPPPPPPAPQPWRISGLVFGDYYYFSDSHLDEWKDQQGFWLRRAYLTFDYDLSARLTTRLRFEANSDGQLEGASLTPYVKDAYIRAALGTQRLFLGISPTASFNWLEGFWGLRHIEKTPVDLYRLDNSRDLGVSLEGPILVKGLDYVAQFGNNSSQDSETNKQKAFRFEGRFDLDPGSSSKGSSARSRSLRARTSRYTRCSAATAASSSGAASSLSIRISTRAPRPPRRRLT